METRTERSRLCPPWISSRRYRHLHDENRHEPTNESESCQHLGAALPNRRPVHRPPSDVDRHDIHRRNAGAEPHADRLAMDDDGFFGFDTALPVNPPDSFAARSIQPHDAGRPCPRPRLFETDRSGPRRGPGTSWSGPCRSFSVVVYWDRY